ncbi:MAG: hypothetical protein LKM36_07780 [Flavobacteriales bacterium]|jgi:hypothetical protein|nr:hypothetical protein [Flavobacteriales bacterium]
MAAGLFVCGSYSAAYAQCNNADIIIPDGRTASEMSSDPFVYAVSNATILIQGVFIGDIPINCSHYTIKTMDGPTWCKIPTGSRIDGKLSIVR